MTDFGVYKAINMVQAGLVKEGIAKDRKCTQGAAFNFRGIDDVYNVLSGLLVESNLVILPRMLAHVHTERTSGKGNPLFHTTVEMEYDFVSTVDGSKHVVGPVLGEAMDSGDKSAGKAMSYAYKAMAFQAFAIPTEGDNDPDNQAHELQPQKKAAQTPGGNASTESNRKNIDSWLNWVDAFAKSNATLDQFTEQWEKFAVPAMKSMSEDHKKELLIAKKEMITFLQEKETKK
jgi:hypothetical protein